MVEAADELLLLLLFLLAVAVAVAVAAFGRPLLLLLLLLDDLARPFAVEADLAASFLASAALAAFLPFLPMMGATASRSHRRAGVTMTSDWSTWLQMACDPPKKEQARRWETVGERQEKGEVAALDSFEQCRRTSSVRIQKGYRQPKS